MALRPPVIPAPEPESPEAHPLRPYVIPAPEPESIRNQPSLVPRISYGPYTSLAQDDVTAAGHEHRPGIPYTSLGIPGTVYLFRF
jgi:hypothetical protein